MSAIRFRKTAKGNLPHLSYILRKPEPLGNEFKTVSCSVTGALLFIEVQRGKEEMKDSRYQKELEATAACTKQMMEATKGIGQKSKKEGTKDCFLFDNWFASKKAAEAKMELGAELIGMVKTNNNQLSTQFHFSFCRLLGGEPIIKQETILRPFFFILLTYPPLLPPSSA